MRVENVFCVPGFVFGGFLASFIAGSLPGCSVCQHTGIHSLKASLTFHLMRWTRKKEKESE